MGEILLATSLILLAAVLFYVNKNKPPNTRSLHQTSYYNPNTSMNDLNRSQHFNYPSYNNNYRIYTPDNRIIRQNQNNQPSYINSKTPLHDEYLNTSNNINNNQINPLTFQNLSNNKIKIINQFFTPVKDDSFLDNHHKGKGLNEFTSALSRPELLIRNSRRSFDDNDLNSDLYNKRRRRKYSNDSGNEVIIKDLSKKPIEKRLKEILYTFKDYFLNSKFLNLNFYKNLLISLMGKIIEYIKGDVEVILKNRIELDKTHISENNKESTDNIRHGNEFNNFKINRNLGDAYFKYEGCEGYDNYKRKISNEFSHNTIPSNYDRNQNLNDYIKNYDQKKLKVRDLIFSDNNTHENFSLNRTLFFKELNNHRGDNYKEEMMNYPNSVRGNAIDKNFIDYLYKFDMGPKINQSNDNMHFLGKIGGYNRFAINPTNPEIDCNNEITDYIIKSPIGMKNFNNQLLESNAMVINNNLSQKETRNLKNEFNLKKIESNSDFEEFLIKNHANNVKNLYPIYNHSKDVIVEEKKNSFSKKDSNRENQIDDVNDLNEDFNKNIAQQKNIPIANLNLNPSSQLKLFGELTPKKIDTYQTNSISGKELYKNDCRGNVENTQNKTKLKPISDPTNTELGFKASSVKLVEKEEAYNTDTNYCEQIGTVKNNEFSELLLIQNASIKQGKVCENKISDSKKLNFKNNFPQNKTKETIHSTIFKRSDDINNNADRYSVSSNSIDLDSIDSENKISNNSKIPSPIPTEKTNKSINLVQKLPSTIKKTEVINSNLLLSSSNKININNQKDSPGILLEKDLMDNKIEDKPKRFTLSSDTKNTNFSINNRNNSRSKKEASNFRKKSNKKMTFAPSEFKDFSELELNKSKENKVISLITEENESNFTKTNLINTPSIYIKNVNIDFTKEKNNPKIQKTPLEKKPELSLLKENLPPKSKV